MKNINAILFVLAMVCSLSYGYYDLVEPEDSVEVVLVPENKNESKINSDVKVSEISRRDPKVITIKENVAPFGLKWGTEYNSSMCDTALFSSDGILDCITHNVPIKNEYFKSYILNFSGTYGLVSASGFGSYTESDPYGRQGIEEYERLKTVLMAKYGEGTPIETVPDTYRKSGKFYQCLNSTGCGDYEYFWSNDTVFVILCINGSDTIKESGWISIRYESKLYDKHMSEIESEKIQKLKDGL